MLNMEMRGRQALLMVSFVLWSFFVLPKDLLLPDSQYIFMKSTMYKMKVGFQFLVGLDVLNG